MALDADSERGEAVRVHEDAAMRTYISMRAGHSYVLVKRRGTPSAIDGFILNEASEIVAMVELKCRFRVTVETFFSTWEGRWLVSYSKIQDGLIIGSMLHVPLVGVLNIVESRRVYWTTLWSKEKGTSARYYVEQTKTQATINGGEAFRPNAYIDMRGANSAAII